MINFLKENVIFFMGVVFLVVIIVVVPAIKSGDSDEVLTNTQVSTSDSNTPSTQDVSVSNTNEAIINPVVPTKTPVSPVRIRREEGDDRDDN